MLTRKDLIEDANRFVAKLGGPECTYDALSDEALRCFVDMAAGHAEAEELGYEQGRTWNPCMVKGDFCREHRDEEGDWTYEFNAYVRGWERGAREIGRDPAEKGPEWEAAAS